MVRLRDSKVSELDTTSLAMHRAVIRAGKPNLEALDWAIWEIWPKMIEPKSIFIFITRPYTILALSILRSEV